MRPRITPNTDDDARLNRILEMQTDLTFLLSVNWSDVDRVIQARVLTHAVGELTAADADDGAHAVGESDLAALIEQMPPRLRALVREVVFALLDGK